MDFYTMNEEILDRALEVLMGKSTGLSAGFHDLDEILEGGFQKGYLYVLGARPSMGKTILIRTKKRIAELSIVRNVSGKYGKTKLILRGPAGFTEMKKVE